jgi:imidazolonepropionase-like amidohydrolase
MPIVPALVLAAVTSVRLASTPGPDPEPFAITSVTVLTMTSNRPLRNATVVVRDGRIAAVGPSGSTPVPADARRIDGRGMFLMPGLIDMHAHLFADEYSPEAAAPAELGLYLALGTTSARLQIGRPQHLELRQGVREGTVAGPRLWVSSPQLSGDSGANTLLVRNAAEARAAIRTANADGYDFIKLTTNITPEVYAAIMAESRATGIRVTGHVDPRVGAPQAIAAGQQIEHLDNYMESILADSAPTRKSVSDVGAYRAANWNSLSYVDQQKLEAIAGATARGGVYVTPTIAFFTSWFATEYTDTQVQARPDYPYLPAAMKGPWERSRTFYWKNAPTAAQRAQYIAIRNRMVKAIVDSGGQVMAGSDGPGGLMAYGWMMHRELQALVAAGLTPYQALRAATVVPATWLGVIGEQGTIEVGKRADLLLLSANPLTDIGNTMTIVGVSAAGTWYGTGQLAQMKETARVAITAPLPPKPAVTTAAPNDEQDVLAVVQRLFDAMRTKDTAAMRQVFDSSATLIGMRPGRDGAPPRVQRLAAAEFAAFVARDQREAWIERAWSPQVRVSGTLATIWADYDFHFGQAFSHCGVDAVQLLKTPDGWKIVSLADTFVRDGCEQHPAPAAGK